MSQGYGSTSAAGGGGGNLPLSQSSNNSTGSSVGFSQEYFNKKGELNPEYVNPSYAPSDIPVFLFEDNDSVTLSSNRQVISGKVSLGQFEVDSVASPFAQYTNNSIVSLQHKTQDIIDVAGNEDDSATEISTGFTKTIKEGTRFKIYVATEEYKTEISAIANNTIDVPSLSQDTAQTQNSASTQSALTVLSELIKPEVIDQIVTSVLSKKKVAPEGVDITVTKCFYKSTSVEEIFKENNRFGILKFASANGIPIIGQTNKIYYSIKELEWMLEQGASAKGSTRQFRFDALLFCLQHPLAIQSFDIIYDMLSATADDAHIKVCAVGGNVLRAFFLALRWARNVAKGVPNEAPDETCDVFTGLSPEQISDLGEFAVTVPNLDFLCDKPSDTDLTIIIKMTKKEKEQYGPIMEHSLNLLSASQGGGDLPECEGPIEFPLIRLKTPIFENGEYYETRCGSIENPSEIMKLANYYFHEIKWFAQMIPDDHISALDALFEKKKATYPKLVEIYPEIRKLYCTLQEVKKHNAVLTSLNSDVISQGSFKELMLFTTTCCQIFFDIIGPEVKEIDDFQNIKQIVQKITPLASRAMFSILKNPITQPFMYRVLETLNDRDYLSSTEFLEKYKTNVHILTDVTGNPMPVKSTCIAVSSIVEGVSEIHKQCSAEIRHLFSELDPADAFNRNINITINCLKFMESNRSIEDIKDAGEQPIETQSSSLKSKNPKNSQRTQKKSQKNTKKSQKPTKNLKNTQKSPDAKRYTLDELKSIVRKYNEGKAKKDQITGFSRMLRQPLIRLMENYGLIKLSGGAKTRKQKRHKTRKGDIA